MKRTIPKCERAAWQHLLIMMNKRKETVVVRKAHLDSVTDCHARSGLRAPRGLVSQIGRSKAVVSRQVLFEFVQEHGEVCGKKADPAFSSDYKRQQERMARARQSSLEAKQNRRSK